MKAKNKKIGTDFDFACRREGHNFSAVNIVPASQYQFQTLQQLGGPAHSASVWKLFCTKCGEVRDLK